MQAALFHNEAKKSANGFFLVEVVVATAVIAIVLVALLGAISKSVQVSTLALQKTQAAYLLDEGAEAVKFIRNGSWDSIVAVADDTPYYLSLTGSTWTLTTVPASIDGFTRTVVFSSVYRDGQSDIATSGAVDGGTRKAVISVSWQGQNGEVTESLPLYITNFNA
jgi:Tfp pilus assembly protein PilV